MAYLDAMEGTGLVDDHNTIWTIQLYIMAVATAVAGLRVYDGDITFYPSANELPKGIS
jgi:hypothetical protein